MKTALLIDWENVKRGLNDQDYWLDDGEIIRLIVEGVQQRSVSGSLDYMASFAPDGVLAASSAAIRSAAPRMNITGTLSGKNAADTELVLAAADLLYDKYKRFVIVSGDVDFVPLAHAIESRQAECEIWAINKSESRRELVEFHRTQFLPDLLGLKKSSVSGAGDAERFQIHLLRLILDGQGPWSYPRTVDALAASLATDRIVVEKLWSEADSASMFGSVDTSEKGKRFRRRRLSYEHPRSLQLHREIDFVLDRTAVMARRSAPISRGELAQTPGAPCDAKRFGQLLPLLVETGLLLESGGNYRLAESRFGFGAVDVFRRVAVVFLHIMLTRDWQLVGRGPFAKAWQRHAKPGGNLTEAERSSVDAQATAVLQSARAAGLLQHGTDPAGRRGYELVADHPLSIEARQTMRTLTDLLLQLGTASTTPEQFATTAKSQSPSPGVWVSAFASQGLVRYLTRDNSVEPKRRNDLEKLAEQL